jgi:hypothetical protein
MKDALDVKGGYLVLVEPLPLLLSMASTSLYSTVFFFFFFF